MASLRMLLKMFVKTVHPLFYPEQVQRKETCVISADVVDINTNIWSK